MTIQTLEIVDERRDAVAASADILGAKWTALLIYDLAAGLWPTGSAPVTAILVVSTLAAAHAGISFHGRLADEALEEVVRLVALSAMFVLAANVFPRVRDVRFLFLVVGLSGVVPALVGLYQWVLVHPLAPGFNFVRVFGTFWGPNSLGQYLALTSVLLIGLPRTALPSWLRVLALVPTLAALVGTLSRSGWALFVIGLVVLGWTRHRRLLAVGLVAAAGLVLAFPTVRYQVLRPDPAEALVQDGVVPFSYRWRLDNAEGLLSTYRHEPVLGYGLRSTPLVNPIGPMDAHNTAVKLLVEGGPLLLAAWVALFVAALRLARRAARTDGALRSEGRILFALWVAVGLVGLTADDPLSGTALMFALLALTGAVAGAMRRRPSFGP